MRCMDLLPLLGVLAPRGIQISTQNELVEDINFDEEVGESEETWPQFLRDFCWVTLVFSQAPNERKNCSELLSILELCGLDKSHNGCSGGQGANSTILVGVAVSHFS